MADYRELIGNLHVHSTWSDGEASYAQIARAAEAAGLNFVIVTDHNVRPEGLEGYYGRVLVLTGEEVHNPTMQPQSNHLLVYGTEKEMSPYSFTAPQTLVQTCRSRDGVLYIAHPLDGSSPISPDLAPIRWTTWPMPEVHGIELWNYMSELKGRMWSYPAALFYALFPDLGIRGPSRAMFRLWDELLSQGRRVSVVGNADAHGTEYSMGPIHRKVLPYEHLFSSVNTHVLCEAMLSGDLEVDKARIYSALRAGRTWIGYDRPHPTRGSLFIASSGDSDAVPGETLKRRGATIFTVSLPANGQIRLVRDGKTVLHSTGQGLRHTTEEPGTYRIEVYRIYKGRRRGWMFTSPIYVE